MRDMDENKEGWIAEFYPVPAHAVTANGSRTLSALAHSIRKWKGLRYANLAKYGLFKPPIEVRGETCALCEEFFNEIIVSCKGCPLFELRGVPCDEDMEYDVGPGAEGRSPFFHYHDTGDPEPMILALETAFDNYAEENAKVYVEWVEANGEPK